MIYKKSPLADLITDKAKDLLSSLENGIKYGQYQSANDLLTAIDRSFKELSKSEVLGTIVVPEYRVGALPLKDDLERPLIGAAALLQTYYEVISGMLSRFENRFNLFNTVIDSLNTRIQELQNQTTQFQLFTTDSTDIFLWASDSFTSTANIDHTQTTALIYNGAASLQVTDMVSLTQKITGLSIDKAGSTGLPGNKLEIAEWNVPTNPEISDEPSVTLISHTDTHSNVYYLLDNNPDTWYEWEYIFIPQKQKLSMMGTAYVSDTAGKLMDVLNVTKGYGWVTYVQWPGSSEWDKGTENKGLKMVDFKEQKTARLVMTLTLSEVTKISAIQITPQIIGASYPKILSIEVSSDNKTWFTIVQNEVLSFKLNESLKTRYNGLPEKDYSGVGIWTMPEQEVKFIRISMEAGADVVPKYGFGHLYYYQVIEKHKSGGWLTKGKTWTEVIRYQSEAGQLASNFSDNTQIQVAGAVLGAALGSAIPVVGTLAGAILGGGLASAMFGGKVTTTVKEEGTAFDVFGGTRSVIAIKGIDISHRKYAEQSQIISRPFIFSKKLRAISIISTEDIPKTWDTSKEWIRFYVSEDGYSWTQITPLNRSKGENDTVMVDSDTIYVKILIERPQAATTETPLLKNYAIKGLPA